ncbi:MAG: hypothetical protein M1156_01305 [Candidatus Marsarchaeota archaeon]|jgi:ribosomal protein S24E|nr:hypothetical protein [Candidatus Marsarchaeota archaeon]
MEINIKIDNDAENKFMKRREIAATASYTGSTPNREIVKQEICKMLNLKPDASAIVNINQRYGSMSSSVLLHSYATKEAMLRFERKEAKKTDAPPAQASEKKEASAAPAAKKAEPEKPAAKDKKKDDAEGAK